MALATCVIQLKIQAHNRLYAIVYGTTIVIKLTSQTGPEESEAQSAV